MQSRLSIVIPVLNDAEALGRLLSTLRSFDGPRAEIVVVDGGSTDGTLAVATANADVVLHSAPGRGRQLRLGTEQANGNLLWMLHADAVVNTAAWRAILSATNRSVVWGRFDVYLTNERRIFRVIESMMNIRSRLTGICTGDQGIFVRADVLRQVGGMPDQPLMEDIQLTKNLKRMGKPRCIGSPVGASARRWEEHGVWRTILMMWDLRIRYFFGADPAALARRYDA